MADRTRLSLALGEQALPLGQLVHVEDGDRVFSQFTYDLAWLRHPKAFAVSPELDLLQGAFIHKPRCAQDPSVFFALADTLPGTWARQIIQYARSGSPSAGADDRSLNDIELLCTVNETCRMGALRVLNGSLPWWHHPIQVPPATLDDLPQAIGATWAVEIGKIMKSDLPFLMAHGVSLGGSRPKVSVRDTNGHLCVAKLPRRSEKASVPLAEVLAMKLASRAGIDTAHAEVWGKESDTPVALIRRFDRGENGQRKPYVSAATLLQASWKESLSYLDLLRAMRRYCSDYADDARQLWRRLVFNLLITNVDDHLQNLGFVYAGQQRWRLAPAFDLNPFPHRDRVSRTPLNVKAGRIRSVQMLLDHAGTFEHTPESARQVLKQVVVALSAWRDVASSREIGMPKAQQAHLAPAFEHEQTIEAKRD
ncbi:type II toxin-antitoxin system HipA family toxin [Hydrogenophaga sp.]|uniref:type II toxin-antitoxin system HipA family toxin n=1 Tax=Hydrogenophaga sp. TaxID=1904254 RepID=UPI0035B0D4F7